MNDEINEYHKHGYLEDLSAGQRSCGTNRILYTPILVVLIQKKKSKERLVRDAAALVHGESLNSHLLTGPDLATSLISILFMFRERRFGDDIKQMPHKITIRGQDPDLQRCLWCKDETQRIRTSEYVAQ